MEEGKQHKLGLVLSGGGARGLAHLGVIKAMEEYGIKPDIIAGTSAGAIAGALIASGHTAEECLTFFQNRKVLDFARFTVSKMGLMVMTGLEKRLEEFLNVRTFDQLKIPLVVVASDLEAGMPEAFESGELIPRLLASASIPIVFIPVEIDGKTYVDGGVFMNLPVRPIRERCEKIIGVEIYPIDKSQKVTNIIHMAERSFHLGLDSNMRIDKKLCDIYIQPPHMHTYSIFEIQKAEQIFEEGYTEAKKVLKDFKFT